MVEERKLSGRYQLIEQLGQGGMGSVWRARRLTNQTEVAIKLIDPELVVSREAVSRFRREAQAAETIRSTHVVQVLDYDVDDDTPFIVMELLKGEDLRRRLQREQALSPEHTAIIMGQVAKAIALAHEHGIVHRDLKPENIFIAREHEDEVVKVLDFGIAKQSTSLGDSRGLRTKTGLVLGTPYYMSPEQASGREANHLADIWSFAVVIFECITGKRAFCGDSFLEVGTAICNKPMPLPSAHAFVPEGFDAWFARAAARKPSERFQTIKAAAEALRFVCGNAGAPPTAALGPARDGSTVTVMAHAVDARTESYLGLGVGGSAMVSTQHTTPSPASRSVLGLARPGRHSKWIIGAAIAAFVVGTTALGVRILGRAGGATAASSAADSPPGEPPSRGRSASPSPSASIAPSSERAARVEVPQENHERPEPRASDLNALPIGQPRGTEAATIEDAPAKPIRPQFNRLVSKQSVIAAARAAAPPAAPTTPAPTASVPTKTQSPNLFGGID